jgi:hypothetical protein
VYNSDAWTTASVYRTGCQPSRTFEMIIGVVPTNTSLSKFGKPAEPNIVPISQRWTDEIKLLVLYSESVYARLLGVL